MNRLPIAGVPSAVNAFTVSDDGKTAYFHDPQTDLLYSVNLQTQIRKALKWEDRSFHHRRWVCYTLFTMQRASGEYLSMLFFNKHKKVFCLIHFLISDELLIKEQTSVLNTSTINWDRLAYTVQKCENEIQIIFYERFSRIHDLEESPTPLHFVYCLVNCTTMRVTSRTGMLPQGQWELPFITNGSIHIISSKRTPHLLASMRLSSESNSWDVRPLTVENSDTAPPRKAMWCNAWSRDGGWYSVTEKVEMTGENAEVLRKTSIWYLDPSAAVCTKLNTSFDLPETTFNFAFRISGDGTGFIHCDVKHREAAIFKVHLTNALKEVRKVKADGEDWVAEEPVELDEDGKQEPSVSREPLADLICPICLETYEDARTLHCGHSMCWECIEQMRINVKSETVSCPTCRKSTKIPAGGLPVNYGLKDAIVTLNRLVALRQNSVRCASCRERYEERKIWTCLSCLKECQHQSDKRTSTNRESMMYIGNVDSFDESNHDSDKKIGEEEKDPVPCDKFLSCSYCAACLLHFHKNHHYEELLHLREREKASHEAKRKWLVDAESKVEEMKNTALDVTNQVLDTILLSNVEKKLEEICNVLENGEDEMGFRGILTMNKLDAIKNQFTEQFSEQLQSFINLCASAQISPTASIISQSAIPSSPREKNLIDVNASSEHSSATSSIERSIDAETSESIKQLKCVQKKRDLTPSSTSFKEVDLIEVTQGLNLKQTPISEAQNIPPIYSPIQLTHADNELPENIRNQRVSLAEMEKDKFMDSGYSYLQSAKSCLNSPITPPLPPSLPPLESEPFVRRPSVLPMRIAVRPCPFVLSQSSPMNSTLRSSPLTAPSLTQALQFVNKNEKRHRPVISEL